MPSPAADLLGAGPLTNTGLGLGSNIGDKPGNIARALELLEDRGIIRLSAVSSIYRTAPWGYVEQDFFANACAVGETRLRAARTPCRESTRLKSRWAANHRCAGDRASSTSIFFSTAMRLSRMPN